MTESMTMLNLPELITFSYLIMALLRDGYFFKERIQIVSMKWPVNTETYLQFLDYRKFWAHPFTYFILTLLNFRSTSKFCKPTRLFVQVYIILYGLKFQLEMMNIMLQMTNIITKCHKRKEKKFSVNFSRKISCNVSTKSHGSCNES